MHIVLFAAGNQSVLQTPGPHKFFLDGRVKTFLLILLGEYLFRITNSKNAITKISTSSVFPLGPVVKHEYNIM